MIAGLALKALDGMAARLNAANQRVLQISSKTVEERIALTLQKLASSGPRGAG